MLHPDPSRKAAGAAAASVPHSSHTKPPRVETEQAGGRRGGSSGEGRRNIPGHHRGELSGGVEDVAGGDGEGGRGLGEVVSREEHWRGQETAG